MPPHSTFANDPARAGRPLRGSGIVLRTALLCAALLGGCNPRPPSADGTGVVNLSGAAITPLARADVRATVLIFVGVECPISNRYAPELRRLQARFTEQGVRWWHVYPGDAYTVDAIREHQRSFQLPDCAALDRKLTLTLQAGARITPEAVVYSPDGRVVYRGRIDDRHPDLTVVRPEPTRRDLELVLEQLLTGQPVNFTETKAVGCFIPRLP